MRLGCHRAFTARCFSCPTLRMINLSEDGVRLTYRAVFVSIIPPSLSLTHTQSLFVALSSDVVDLVFHVSVSKLPKLYHPPQMSFTGRQSQTDNVNETTTVVCASIIYSLILLTLTSTTCLSSQTQETCLHLTGKSGDQTVQTRIRD